MGTVLTAAFTAWGVMAESMVTGAVSRRVESVERVDTAAIAESTMLRLASERGLASASTRQLREL